MDMERLRRDLEDYYGTAAFSGMPAAFLDASAVRRESDRELLRRARDCGFDLNRYETDRRW